MNEPTSMYSLRKKDFRPFSLVQLSRFTTSALFQRLTARGAAQSRIRRRIIRPLRRIFLSIFDLHYYRTLRQNMVDRHSELKELLFCDCLDYDADYFGENTSNNKPEEVLSWRLDPTESLSDWTITIQSENSGTVKEYHVHKNILAVGPAKADYFSSLFRNSIRLLESSTNTSNIKLEDAAAKVFPGFLDFMYSPRKKAAVTRNNAVALRYLSQYFGVRLLHTKTTQFIRGDMKLDSITDYIDDAMTFHDEKVLSLAANKIAENIEGVEVSSPLLTSMDPHFFSRIVSSAEIDTCGESSHLSILIATYCKLHTDEIDAEMFAMLTSKNNVPFIHRDAAIPLLEVEATTSNAADSDKPSCLQKRCTRVLALDWKHLASNHGVGSPTYRKLPAPVLAQLLEKSLNLAKNCCEEWTTTRDKEAHTLLVASQKTVAQLESIQAHHQEEIERIQGKCSEKIARLKSVVAGRDRQMSEYEKELSKFARLPVTHSFQSVTNSTYHHKSGNEPFDAATNEFDRYGRIRPTAVPRFGDNTEDGYVYTQRKGTGYENWPLYYYKDN